MFFKLILIFFPSQSWQICVSDDITPRQTSFAYEYYEKDCTKSFDNIFSNKTKSVEKVEFGILNENYEWMGHNSTNFPLGFLNHAAFNHYDLRRDWLPPIDTFDIFLRIFTTVIIDNK